MASTTAARQLQDTTPWYILYSSFYAKSESSFGTRIRSFHNSLDSRQLEFLSATSLGVLANADHGATNAGLALLPALGSSCIMLTIVALLYSWEKSVEWARETLPGELRPVVESILGEIGGLGFVGLLLQTLLQSRSNKEIVF